MMMRKEEEQHSNKFPALCTASQHVGHICAGGRGERVEPRKENIRKEDGDNVGEQIKGKALEINANSPDTRSYAQSQLL